MKKLVLLPILLLALTACGGTSSSSESSVSQGTSTTSSSSEVPSSSSSSSSVQLDARVWAIVGSFGTSAWTPTGTDYDLTRIEEGVNRFSITVDIYKDQEFQVIHDRTWTGQLGWAAVRTVDPTGSVVEGSNGGGGANIMAAVDGSFQIILDTTNYYVPKVDVTRLGDPVVPAPIEHTYVLAGDMNSWNGGVDNESYILAATETEGTYAITLDLYVNQGFKIVMDGSTWLGGGLLGTVDPAECVGGTDNIVVAVEGNYTVSLVEGDVKVINVVRLGDAIVPGTHEEDNGGWYLTGTINSWDQTDATSYPLVAVDGVEHTYAGTFDFAADAEFVINAGGTWDLKRGPSKVIASPETVDLSGDNIKVLEATSLTITFVWATDLGGEITIETYVAPVLPVEVPAVNLLAANVANDVVTLTEAYVISNVSVNSVAAVATAAGTGYLNYYNSDATTKADCGALVVGSYITVTGTVGIATGGDPKSAKVITPTAVAVVESPSWTFGSLASAGEVDMDGHFKDWFDNLALNDLGVVYTFTNVQFTSVGTATSTSTAYDYFYWSSKVAVADVNNIGTTTYSCRIGLYHIDYDSSALNTSSLYTVTAMLAGANQAIPLAGTDNTILRLSAYVSIVPQV